MTTPTPAQHAAIVAIHQRAANDNPSSGWTDIAVMTALEYAEEVTRERDEARRLVASLTATAHMQAGIMEAELKLLTETHNRDLSDALAVLLKRFNEGESK